MQLPNASHQRKKIHELPDKNAYNPVSRLGAGRACDGCRAGMKFKWQPVSVNPAIAL